MRAVDGGCTAPATIRFLRLGHPDYQVQAGFTRSWYEEGSDLPSATRSSGIAIRIFFESLLALLLAGEAQPAHAAPFTVSSFDDAVDANPGNGVRAGRPKAGTLGLVIPTG